MSGYQINKLPTLDEAITSNYGQGGPLDPQKVYMWWTNNLQNGKTSSKIGKPEKVSFQNLYSYRNNTPNYKKESQSSENFVTNLARNDNYGNYIQMNSNKLSSILEMTSPRNFDKEVLNKDKPYVTALPKNNLEYSTQFFSPSRIPGTFPILSNNLNKAENMKKTINRRPNFNTSNKPRVNEKSKNSKSEEEKRNEKKEEFGKVTKINEKEKNLDKKKNKVEIINVEEKVKKPSILKGKHEKNKVVDPKIKTNEIDLNQGNKTKEKNRSNRQNELVLAKTKEMLNQKIKDTSKALHALSNLDDEEKSKENLNQMMDNEPISKLHLNVDEMLTVIKTMKVKNNPVLIRKLMVYPFKADNNNQNSDEDDQISSD